MQGEHARSLGPWVAAVAVLMGLWTTRYVHFSPDSIRYALVSNELRLHHRLATPTSSLGRPPDPSGTVPLTAQPPLLPAVLALMGGVTPQRLWPVRALNTFCFAVTCLVSYLIGRRLAGGTAGLAAAGLLAVSLPLLYVSSRLWSEPPFIALMMLCVWAVQRSREARRRSAWLLVAGTAAAAGAIATRFAGAALLPLLAWESLVAWRRDGPRPAGRSALLTLPVPLACVTVLFARNFLLTGHVRGFGQAAPDHSFLGSIWGMAVISARQFWPGRVGVLPVLIVVLMLAPLAGWLVLRVRRPLGPRGPQSRDAAAGDPDPWRRGVDVVVVAGLCYFALLVFALTWGQPRFEVRFAAPLAPMLLILVAVSASRAGRVLRPRPAEKGVEKGVGSLFLKKRLPTPFCRRPAALRGGPAGRLARAAPLAWLGLLAILLGYQAQVRGRSRPPRLEILESPTLKWVAAHTRPGQIVVGNATPWTAFYFDRPAMGIPWRGHNPKVTIPPDMPDRLPRTMPQVGARYLVLVTGQREVGRSNYGEFIEGLMHRRSTSPRFRLVADFPDGVIYELLPPPSTQPDATGD